MNSLYDFLAPSRAKFDVSDAREYANSIANCYFNSKQDPTTELIKVAQVNSFTPEQVKVVATEVNKAIHNANYKSVTDKYAAAEFPLADAAKALKALQLDNGEVKLAGQFVDPIIEGEYGLKYDDMFGVKDEPLDKTASVKHRVKYAKEKLELLDSKISDEIEMNKVKLASAERTFIKTARAAILESYNPADRLDTFGNIYAAFQNNKLEKVANTPLAKLALILAKEGLIEKTAAKETVDYLMSKEADQKAPEHLISKNLQGLEIVNGQHPLYITLNTLDHHIREQEALGERFKIVQDKLNHAKQKIRAL